MQATNMLKARKRAVPFKGLAMLACIILANIVSVRALFLRNPVERGRNRFACLDAL